eukprot:GHUV01036281.1.p1 GENE.GHUV01036281.1~~GHUV01036281.1.p1  ORF type:complete len:221 (+),score=51.85 GHUV01036281.1:1-663(+)
MPQFQCYCYRDPDSSPEGQASWLSSSSSSSAAVQGYSEQQRQQQQWSCTAPGDDATTFPFNCTLDQVFSPQLMYHHLPVFASRPLNFREASFLGNPRTPSWLRHAATRISSGSPSGCDAGSDGSSSGVVGDGKCAQALPGRPVQGGNQQVGRLQYRGTIEHCIQTAVLPNKSDGSVTIKCTTWLLHQVHPMFKSMQSAGCRHQTGQSQWRTAGCHCTPIV